MDTITYDAKTDKVVVAHTDLQVIEPGQHDRMKYIGGADIAAVIGISPWRTPHELWLDKSRPRVEGAMGRRNPKARGVRWESVVAEMLVEQLQEDGHDVEIVAMNRRYKDADLPFLASEIDFEIILDGEDEITNVELKTVHPFKLVKDGWGESGTDQMPTHYTAQVMHGLGVTRRRKGILAALFGADELRAYPVAADDAVINYLRGEARRFWNNHVIEGVAPPPINLKDLDRLYPKELEGGAPLLADEGLVHALLRLRAVDKEIKAREAEALTLEFEVKQHMKDAVAVVLPNGKTAVEWKLREGKALDHDALKEALGVKGYQKAHKPWQSRVFSLKPFATEGL
jgi:putative phage-type endonuclease